MNKLDPFEGDEDGSDGEGAPQPATTEQPQKERMKDQAPAHVCSMLTL